MTGHFPCPPPLYSIYPRMTRDLPHFRDGSFAVDEKTRAPAAHHQYTTKGEATPHQLRHAYATMLHEAGIDAKDAQYILGHSSITVTEDIYTHITKDRQTQNLFKIDGYLNQKEIG